MFDLSLDKFIKPDTCQPLAKARLVSYTWFCAKICVLCACMCVCACLPPRLLITSGVIQIQYDWLNKFYTFYMAAIVSIVSRSQLTIEAYRRNQTNKSKLALYKRWIHFHSYLKQFYINNKTERFSYNGGCGLHGRTLIETFKRRVDLGYR